MKSSAAPCCANSDASAPRGRIFNIQRFSLHDGPGIRTVVFLQGCPLRCVWCANPEGIGGPADVHCPDGPQRRAGETRGVAEVHRQVMADEAYYRTSGGGVTLSGGEMAQQPDFARALLAACRRDGVHTAVETSGFASWSALRRACEFSQLVLYDLKLADAARHRRYTGVSLRPIVRNLQRLLAGDIPVRIRIPAIPQVNDGPAQARAMMELIHALTRHSASFAGIELLPYHSFGVNKYTQLGLPYRYAEMHPGAGPADTGELERAARGFGMGAATLAHCIG